LLAQVGLRVELDENRNVSLVPTEDVPQYLWSKVVQFWAPDDFKALPLRSITVTLEEFVDKAAWLQAAWLDLGHELRISQQVLDASDAVHAGTENFRRLGTLSPDRHAGKKATVPGLKPNYDLTPEQHENLLCLLEMQNGANFSVPGSGKTLTSLSLWKILRASGDVDKALVIGPRSSFSAWGADLDMFFEDELNVQIFAGGFIEDDSDLVLINYEQLENPEKLSYLKNWVSLNNALLILDEAHRIKGGRASVRWRGAKVLSDASARTEVLTGTPMPQSPVDLTALFQVAWPRLSKRSLDSRLLLKLVRKTAFVRTTKNELRIPEASIRLVREPASPLHQEILDALLDKYGGLLDMTIADRKNLAKRGKAVMTVLAAATNPGLLSSSTFSEIEMGFSWPPQSIAANASLLELVENFTHHEMPWKFKYVALRAEELRREGKKLLVWTSFVGNIAGLKRVLRNFQPAVVYGGTDPVLREQEIQRFRSDPECSVLISNPQTLGEGISLHKECNVEIFVDRTYNAGLYLQAVDRIHRLGLPADQETVIEILQTSGTIDERVHIRLEAKIRALSNFLQDPHLVLASLPQDDAFAAVDVLGISDDDFDDLMGVNS
jgi:SNF2 family DNA or RNA helicase